MQTRSLTKVMGASLPSPGTVCTKCHQDGHISRHCAKVERLIVPLRVPLEMLTRLARTQPGLSTLPREIREIIYRNLVTSPMPIKVCYDFNTSTVYLRLWEGGKRGIAAAFLCDAVHRSLLAMEIYEAFFKSNTFECGDCKILEEFIHSRCTDLEIRMSQYEELLVQSGGTFAKARVGEPYRPLKNWRKVNFNNRPWVRHLRITMHCDHQESKAAEQLGLVLKFPRLQSIGITIHGLCAKRDMINSIDQKIAQIAEVCKKIRERIGARLTVRVLKSWLGVCISQSHHCLYENLLVKWEDVSWMWEPPSEEAKLKVETWRTGTHREHLQVLMATKDLTQTSQLRVFGEHWLQDRKELQRLAKSKTDAKNATH